MSQNWKNYLFSELVTERKGLKYPQLIRFYQLIDKEQEEFKFSSLSESFEGFLKSINFFEYIKSEKNSEQKLENIYFFLKQLEQYEKDGGASFTHFLQNRELFAKRDGDSNMLKNIDNMYNKLEEQQIKQKKFFNQLKHLRGI